MSDLVYMRTSMGGVSAEIWHGPPFVGVNDMVEKNSLGNFRYPHLGGEKILARIPIKDGEEALGIDALVQKYPFREGVHGKGEDHNPNKR